MTSELEDFWEVALGTYEGHLDANNIGEYGRILSCMKHSNLYKI